MNTRDTNLQNKFMAKTFLFGFLMTTSIFVLLLISLSAFGFSPQIVLGGFGQSDEVRGSLNTYANEIEPATALTNGRPTLYIFYPMDTCKLQSCQDPAEVVQEMKSNLSDQIDLVMVTTHSLPYNESRHHIAPMPFDNWDIMPVEPYVNWLPQLTETEFGWGLDGIEMVMVSAGGRTGQLVSSVADLN